MFRLSVFACVCLSGVAGFGQQCDEAAPLKRRTPADLPPDAYITPPNTVVAFLGDQGNRHQGRGPMGSRVLNMIRDKQGRDEVDFVLHLGDFDYSDDPVEMEEMIDEELGADFPYFAAIGNHDFIRWAGEEGYSAKLVERLERFGGEEYCWGDYGTKMACLYKGLLFVLSGVGTWGFDHNVFIEETFEETPVLWRICNWHKNQRMMQIGGKISETGWNAYQACLRQGAMVATGHEHSWCRSHTMTSFEDQRMLNSDRNVHTEPGQSFVFVSGVGGRSIRSWTESLATREWWASVGASTNNLRDGALFCSFNHEGVPDHARCYFEDVEGTIWDQFDITSANPTSKEQAQAQARNSTTAAPRHCGRDLVEFPVTATADDMMVRAGASVSDESTLHLSQEGDVVVLQFHNIDIDSVDDISDVTLQVMGAEEGDDLASITIRAFSPSLTGALADSSQVSVEWTELEGDRTPWEKHEVWVVSVADAVRAVVGSPDWVAGSSLALHLTSHEGTRAFYSFDHSKCAAPTLAVEFRKEPC